MLRRVLATLVRAEVVMTGGDTVTVTQQHPARGRTTHPGHAQPRPDQEHRGRGEEYSSTWSDRIQVYADAIIVEIRSIL